MLKINLASMVGNEVTFVFDQPIATDEDIVIEQWDSPVVSLSTNSVSQLDTGFYDYPQPYNDDQSLNNFIPYKAHSYKRERSYDRRRRLVIGRIFKWIIRIFIGLFFVIGLMFTGVYIGMQLGLFNVQGSIADRDSFYGNLTKAAPVTSVKPTATALANSVSLDNCAQIAANCAWEYSSQWATVSEGLGKDTAEINQAASQTGVSARMIISAIAPEQLRLFTSERETYENYFQPLKILGSMTSFSLGIAGIKQQTAQQIEANAKSVNSPFYPGSAYANLITYPNDHYSASLQYDRLTSNNHYYDYLYTGLFIRELEAQWLKAGYNIDQRPDVITTLYNIGFSYSQPKANPKAGGTTITLNGNAYSFGELGTLIYNSDQLSNTFPLAAN